MKMGFSGTREGMTQEQVDGLTDLIEILEPIEFHFGLCRGADIQAAEYAMCYRLRKIGHPGPKGDPNQREYPCQEMREPKSHLERNRNIVAESDVLVACPKELTEQDRGGTWHTIRYALKQGKWTIILFPDGSRQEHNKEK